MAKTKNKKKTTKKDGSKHKKNKKKYKVRNWSEYNQMLADRGRIDVWVEKGILEQWYHESIGKKRGSQKTYSNLAINITLQYGLVFHQKLRQTEGLLRSLFKAMDIELSVPDFTTLSRRGETLTVELPKEKQEKINIILDSSGLKVYGEGEWKVRKHGWGKRRTWRKIHLSVTPDGEIRELELTENNVSDEEAATGLISREESDIAKVAGDGAYDRRKVYNACRDKKVETIAIPPQRNARIWFHGNRKGKSHPRDGNLRTIRKIGRKQWKEQIGYHVRSMGENAYYRWKTIFGDKLNARKIENQITEARIKAAILNKMRNLGMPDSYATT